MNNLVLVVDDDAHVCELLRVTLVNQQFQVEIARDGQEALAKFHSVHPDLLILDLMLPKQNGLEVCREIRKISNVPILMLTAKGEELDKVLGLELGADDYVIKPFSPRELTARVRAILRRVTTAASQSNLLRYGNMSIDLQGHQVKAGPETIPLTPKEFELLSFLALNPGRVFTRDQLLTNVWGYDYVGDARTVDEHVKRLRQKVESRCDKRFLKTIWGLGYKFEVSQD